MTEHFKSTCSLCEACCGVILEIEKDRILRVMPDREDPLSGGFVCPKGAVIGEVDADPDRLRTPLLKTNGAHHPISWDEAFGQIEKRIGLIQKKHGRNAVGLYVGNGAAHNYNLHGNLHHLLSNLGSQNFFTSGTVDQVPRQVVSMLLYGSELSVPLPDLDRCQLLWIIGANPAESNGSMLTTPGFVGRANAIKRRGGRVIVIDPQRTRTAQLASEHLAIRPSADGAFLAAVANTLLKLKRAENKALHLCGDLTFLESWLEPFTPEYVADACGIDAETIVRLAAGLCETEKAAVYGRMGTTTQAFSSLVVWLMDLVNILAGNVDVEGGAMFATPLFAQENTLGDRVPSPTAVIGKWKSRVSGLPEALHQLPVACLPEEIETPGPGQIKALVTIAANPVISNPDANRLRRALSQLEFMVSYDTYINETTQYADLILPSPSRLTQFNYDSWFYQFAVRNYGRYTPAYRTLRADEKSDREISLRLAMIFGGLGANGDIDTFEMAALRNDIGNETRRPASEISGRDAEKICNDLSRLPIELRRLDFMFRIGPFGDGFGSKQGIKFEDVAAAGSGLDLGPLVPRLPNLLRTGSGQIDIKQGFAREELRRLKEWVDKEKPRYVLVGRRQLRSNNSWMHNIPSLRHATRQCTLRMNTEDAAQSGLKSGDLATVSTEHGSINVQVETTDAIAAGVVSLPHGWGHEALDGGQRLSSKEPGVNVNELTGHNQRDPLTNTAVVNGYAVQISTSQCE